MSWIDEAARMKAAHPAEKDRWDRAHLWIGWAMRPLSWPLSGWLYTKGVSANQVTLATAIAGFGALPMLACGRPGWRLAGALWIVVYSYLDCVDGNLARSRPPEVPPRGKFFDQLVGQSYNLAYLALAIGLREQRGAVAAWELVHRGVGATLAWQALALGALATVSKYASTQIRHDFWNVLGPDWTKAKAGGGAGGATLTSGPFYVVYCTLAELQSHAPLLPLAVAFGLSFQFLAASSAVLSLELLAFAALYLRRAWRMPT